MRCFVICLNVDLGLLLLTGTLAAMVVIPRYILGHIQKLADMEPSPKGWRLISSDARRHRETRTQ